ncbi:nucleotide exchange factor GrpE [Granulicoccus phenolivorans]|uniref:nucleotide exchange factor GrpE n=1 Tax=Granulicoccus phenolivorans TaxID=266854 RepID=UPI00068546CB|nr:nucleotide exchange factor GrpE [Granulicoccus phenolivorans]
MIVPDTIEELELLEEAGPADREADLAKQLAERTEDLQRLGAEYANYKRRVDRDRAAARQAGIESVLNDMLPVLDSIAAARQHEGELTGGFKLLADELEKLATKHGLVSYAAKGEPFDPQIHDALMQAPMPGATEPTVLDVMQQGFKLNDRVLRAARVAVGMPAEEPATDNQTDNN